MFYWIYDISTPQLALMITGVFVLFFWVGCFVFRPVLRMFVRSRGGTNDIVGYILSCFGVFYGLLLGLIAVAAYQNLNDVEEDVAREGVALTALYQDVTAYPEPLQGRMQGELRGYGSYVLKTAWPEQSRGIVPVGGTQRVRAFRDLLFSFVPETTREAVYHADTLRQFDLFYAARRQRIHDVSSGIPAVMWYVVIVGAIINIAIVWMFEMRLTAQLVLGGLLAFFMGTMIFLIAAMDHPFRGGVSVAPDAFSEALEMMDGESA